jgi:hypothetical protein
MMAATVAIMPGFFFRDRWICARFSLKGKETKIHEPVMPGFIRME